MYLNMLLINVVVAISALALTQITEGFEFNVNSYYAIESLANNTYLKMENNADPRFECEESLGDVVTNTTLDPSSPQFRWSCDSIEDALDDNLRICEADNENELTYGIETSEDSDPPLNCSASPNIFHLTLIVNSTFVVKNSDSGKCLTNVGVDERIDWKKCRKSHVNNKNQLWNFIELEV